MKKHLFAALILTLSVMLAAPAMLLAGNGNAPADRAAPQAQAEPGKGQVGKIPQAQLDYIKKREEAKKRRDELLKLRQQNINSMNSGSAPVNEAPQ